MSDNTPTDGKKNPETDAAAAPDLSPAEHGSSDQSGAPEHAVPVVPEQEPIVIDYDAINANLSAAERADAQSASAATRNLAPMSTAAPVSPAEADAPSLADDYADSYTPAATVPATSTAFDSEPVVQIVPEERIVATAAAVEQPVEDVPVAAAPTYTPPTQSPIYVQAPTKPKDRSNRGGGILIALLATVVFAVLYAVAAFIIIGVTSTSIAATVDGFSSVALLPLFYIPIIFFFLAFAALISLVNRGGWWAYVLFGFLVAVVVYFAYIGGALLGLVFDGRADGLSPAEIGRIVGTLWLNPGAIAAALIAREVPIWAGAWIARRGRRVTAKNLESRTEYERLLADGPHLTRP
ncbi:hypothetical protein E3O25_10270 [Cryobacterium sp. TMT1-3]|uniref:Uncharacterized protein n=1 Tax=Cryobacterium luteum TaxID=1424661 RepID=A0A1H8C1R6_9MICO|nr:MULTISPECIES: hypothetical protein [Cryobacterium]TFB89217.1 hypothetical protein E3O10_10075 [Cryobacterium luteum]TFC27472.1 hypothetical protein E3O25_10270 [Cryobacterium sp. TMT1-3]SEM89065.1 hypothetical protein SAMN05216281_102207 [Cryobacterium luteum]